MTSKLLTLSAVLALGACAYAFDGALQEVEIVTPGAENAKCFIILEKTRYTVNPPEIITIEKSGENMDVQCKAPGNRERNVIIKPQITNAAALSLAGGVVPIAADLTSDAVYVFPDRIEVSFEGMAVKPYPMPAHNAPDIKQPEEYRLEEFRPGLPRLNSDGHSAPVKLKRRQPYYAPPAEYADEGFVEDSGAMESSGQEIYLPPVEPAPPRAEYEGVQDKGDLQSVDAIADDLDPGFND